ncbi:MAG: FecR family protein [Prolixibacteraceae bacterium]
MEDELLGKYFAEDAKNMQTDEGDESVSAKDRVMIEETKRILEGIDLLQKMEAVDSVKANKKVKDKLGLVKDRKWMKFIQKVAAILLLPLLSLAIWQFTQISDFNHSIVQNVITTPPTLRSVFTLPDGTKVWMNGNTTITYPTFFKGNERLVEFSGEAYFQVAHNRQKPFIVKSGNLLVEAVGTEFNFCSFNDDLKQETLLTEGKVNILVENGHKREILGTLTQNQLVTYNKKNATFQVQNVDPEKYIAWKNGQIIFKNDVLGDVLKRLERWYNVDFISDKPMKKDYAFTGSFAGEELTQILNYIELTTPITFEVLKTKKDTNDIYQKTRIKMMKK